jgi:hypothetical protein
MHMRNKHNITKRDNPEMFWVYFLLDLFWKWSYFISSSFFLDLVGAIHSFGDEENGEIETEVQKRMIQTTDLIGLRMWQCADCPYKVKNSNDLRKHVERKHLICQVTCDICGQAFNCRYRLQQHNRKFHFT